ncbi:hypothetical protein EN794_000955 [Mesorhizobium sp. M00.F.Ca.ET.151.01.1.1]|nr:hypothetical protein EN794_000955 [Mesorhizobium sp. M00.F.Ca.ET.151.01.1.1]
MSGKRDALKVPRSRTGEKIARGTVRAIVELIPGAGLVTTLAEQAWPSREDEEQEAWQHSVTVQTNEHSEEIYRIKQIVGAFITMHANFTQATQASELSFLPGGMVEELQEIADGRATTKSLKILRQKLKETEREVVDIIKGIRVAMGKLVANDPFREKMQIAIYGESGKLNIRRKIEELLAMKASDPYLPSLAHQLCDDITEFNRVVLSLGREAAADFPLAKLS